MKTILNTFCVLLFLFIPGIGQAQLLSVSGYVKDYVTDKALENASVYETVSGIGTISNNKGYYKLLLKPGKHHLVISSAGFERFSKDIVLPDDTTITVRLKPENFQQSGLVAGGDVKAGGEHANQKATAENK